MGFQRSPNQPRRGSFRERPGSYREREGGGSFVERGEDPFVSGGSFREQGSGSFVEHPGAPGGMGMGMDGDEVFDEPEVPFPDQGGGSFIEREGAQLYGGGPEGFFEDQDKGLDSYHEEDIPYGEPLGPQGGAPGYAEADAEFEDAADEEFYGREHVAAHQGQFGGMQQEPQGAGAGFYGQAEAEQFPEDGQPWGEQSPMGGAGGGMPGDYPPQRQQRTGAGLGITRGTSASSRDSHSRPPSRVSLLEAGAEAALAGRSSSQLSFLDERGHGLSDRGQLSPHRQRHADPYASQGIGEPYASQVQGEPYASMEPVPGPPRGGGRRHRPTKSLGGFNLDTFLTAPPLERPVSRHGAGVGALGGPSVEPLGSGPPPRPAWQEAERPQSRHGRLASSSRGRRTASVVPDFYLGADGLEGDAGFGRGTGQQPPFLHQQHQQQQLLQGRGGPVSGDQGMSSQFAQGQMSYREPLRSPGAGGRRLAGWGSNPGSGQGQAADFVFSQPGSSSGAGADAFALAEDVEDAEVLGPDSDEDPPELFSAGEFEGVQGGPPAGMGLKGGGVAKGASRMEERVEVGQYPEEYPGRGEAKPMRGTPGGAPGVPLSGKQEAEMDGPFGPMATPTQGIIESVSKEVVAAWGMPSVGPGAPPGLGLQGNPGPGEQPSPSGTVSSRVSKGSPGPSHIFGTPQSWDTEGHRARERGHQHQNGGPGPAYVTPGPGPSSHPQGAVGGVRSASASMGHAMFESTPPHPYIQHEGYFGQGPGAQTAPPKGRGKILQRRPNPQAPSMLLVEETPAVRRERPPQDRPSPSPLDLGRPPSSSRDSKHILLGMPAVHCQRGAVRFEPA